VVDVFTRECLALEADTCLGSGRVTRVLERLIDERGLPEGLRSDNGPEFTSRRMWSARLELCQWRRETLDKESIWPEGRSTSLSRW
jgi:transposase InsO family protein